MPWLFIRWLLVRFFWNLCVVGSILTSVLTVFDLLANASEIALGSPHPLLALLFYMLFRVPVIANFILPFAVLLASVITCNSLAAQREILALESCGFHLPKIALTLSVGALALAVGQFYLADELIPDVTERLNEWKDGDYVGLPAPEKITENPEWFASGNQIVHMGHVSLDGMEMARPTVIETNPSGVATRYWEAHRATASELDQGWRFEHVRGRDFAPDHTWTSDHLVVPMELPSELFPLFSKPVEELRFSQLRALGAESVLTQKFSKDLYRTWMHARMAQPLGGVAMVLLAAPLCLHVQRTGRRILLSCAILTLGFLYFLLQNVLLALAGNGHIPPVFAAWVPLLAFGILSLMLLTRRPR